jgi:hypothetical protein
LARILRDLARPPPPFRRPVRQRRHPPVERIPSSLHGQLFTNIYPTLAFGVQYRSTIGVIMRIAPSPRHPLSTDTRRFRCTSAGGAQTDNRGAMRNDEFPWLTRRRRSARRTRPPLMGTGRAPWRRRAPVASAWTTYGRHEWPACLRETAELVLYCTFSVERNVYAESINERQSDSICKFGRSTERWW